MPELGLCRLMREIKLWKALYFILELNDEPNLGRHAEVPNNQETDSFKKCLPLKLLFIAS